MSSIPNQVKRYSSEVAVVFESQVDKAADQARDFLSTQDWIPDSIRPRGRPSPSTALALPTSLYDAAQDWISRHKILTGFIVLTTGVVVYRGIRKSALCRKTRRARRARNGARLDVVVIAGSPNLPVTRSLALDLERRGFIVYIVCNTVDDEVVVQNLSRTDIRPLGIDITDVSQVPLGPGWACTCVLVLDAVANLKKSKNHSLPARASLSNGSPSTCRHLVRPCLERNHTISL